MSDGFSNSTVGGIGNLIRSWIQSVPFISGSSGWRISKNGNAEFNALTARGIVILSGSNGIFIYNGTPAAGSLVGSIAATAGTDSFGNNYPVGIQFTDGVRSVLSTMSNFAGTGAPQIRWKTGGSTEKDSMRSSCAIQGSGANRAYTAQHTGPSNSNGFDDFTLIQFLSSEDGFQAANGALIYVPVTGSGGSSVSHTWDWAGLKAIGTFTGVQPGTGTSYSNTAIGESWHTLILAGGFQPLAGFGVPRYQYEGTNGGRLRLSGAVQLTANQAQSTQFSTVPAGWAPATVRYFLTANNLSGGTGRIESLHVQPGGGLEIGNAGSTGNYVFLDGVCVELD